MLELHLCNGAGITVMTMGILAVADDDKGSRILMEGGRDLVVEESRTDIIHMILDTFEEREDDD